MADDEVLEGEVEPLHPDDLDNNDDDDMASDSPVISPDNSGDAKRLRPTKLDAVKEEPTVLEASTRNESIGGSPLGVTDELVGGQDVEMYEGSADNTVEDNTMAMREAIASKEELEEEEDDDEEVPVFDFPHETSPAVFPHDVSGMSSIPNATVSAHLDQTQWSASVDDKENRRISNVNSTSSSTRSGPRVVKPPSAGCSASFSTDSTASGLRDQTPLSPGKTVMEGEVFIRKGLVRRRWTPRSATIFTSGVSGRVLMLFKQEEGCKGQAIPLKNASCVAGRVLDLHGAPAYGIVIKTPKSKLKLAVRDQGTRDRWLLQLQYNVLPKTEALPGAREAFSSVWTAH